MDYIFTAGLLRQALPQAKRGSSGSPTAMEALPEGWQSSPNGLAVIDGSNMAHLGESKKARVKYLELVVDEARRQGYSPIVFVDAYLRHEIDDQKKLEDLIRVGKVRQVPARTQADEFILQEAEHLDAVVVSNDLFKPYQGEFPWVVDSARFRRVTLSFDDNTVYFSRRAGQKSPPSMPPQTKICTGCGEIARMDSKFCRKCGMKFPK